VGGQVPALTEFGLAPHNNELPCNPSLKSQVIRDVCPLLALTIESLTDINTGVHRCHEISQTVLRKS